jgi:hypothetical protein
VTGIHANPGAPEGQQRICGSAPSQDQADEQISASRGRECFKRRDPIRGLLGFDRVGQVPFDLNARPLLTRGQRISRDRIS